MEPEDKKFLITLCLLGTLVLALIAAIIAAVAVLDPPAKYSVAVTGLDADNDTAAPASFELTIHINNPSRLFRACVNDGATAAVSRNGTAVARGAVPPFCAGRRGRQEATAPARAVDGGGAAAAGSSAMRRGGAVVVDVAVPVPHVHIYRRIRHVQDRTIACRGVRVGGGLSPCTSWDP